MFNSPLNMDMTGRTTASSGAETRIKTAIMGKVGKKATKKSFLKNLMKKKGSKAPAVPTPAMEAKETLKQY